MSAQRFSIDPEADGRHDVGKMESCSHTERRTVTHIHTVGEQQQGRTLSALSHTFSLLLSFLGTLSGIFLVSSFLSGNSIGQSLRAFWGGFSSGFVH